jgi:hypothetical protein
MKQVPTIWRMRDLLESVSSTKAQINNKWVPARPLGGIGIPGRIRATWLVFTGRADAVVWPEGQ